LRGFNLRLITGSVLTPFRAHNHGTGGMFGEGIPIPIRIQVVPEDGSSSPGIYGIPYVYKDCGSTLFNVSQLKGMEKL